MTSTGGKVGSFKLHLLDVGQGEAIVLDLPDGDFALIDAGPSSSADVVVDAVKSRHDAGRRFRFAALTHCDSDHIGGFPAVLAECPPDEFVEPTVDLSALEHLSAHLEGRAPSLAIDELRNLTSGIPRTRLGARSQLRDVSDGVEIWALSPTSSVDQRVNEALKNPTWARFRNLRNSASLVLWLRVFNTGILLPGEVDADVAHELELAFGSRKGRIHVDDYRAVWLKLSHHGSESGTDPELLRIFAHDTFVASVSHGARYGHPHPRALHAVREASGRMMCTRLGKGCHLISTRPDKYSAGRLDWVDKVNWNGLASVDESCYGTITVEVNPSGACVVSGSDKHRDDCPYGGPKGGEVVELRTPRSRAGSRKAAP